MFSNQRARGKGILQLACCGGMIPDIPLEVPTRWYVFIVLVARGGLDPQEIIQSLSYIVGIGTLHRVHIGN